MQNKVCLGHHPYFSADQKRNKQDLVFEGFEVISNFPAMPPPPFWLSWGVVLSIISNPAAPHYPSTYTLLHAGLKKSKAMVFITRVHISALPLIQ